MYFFVLLDDHSVRLKYDCLEFVFFLLVPKYVELDEDVTIRREELMLDLLLLVASNQVYLSLIRTRMDDERVAFFLLL